MVTAAFITVEAAALGKIIQRLRLERGWSIAELARRSGFNKGHLSLLEHGRNTPSLYLLLDLADLFHVNASDILREVEQARREAKSRRAAATPAAAGLTPSEG